MNVHDYFLCVKKRREAEAVFVLPLRGFRTRYVCIQDVDIPSSEDQVRVLNGNSKY